MSLAELLEGTPARVVGSTDVEIHGVVHDSRQVHAGDLFVALPGARDRGSRYLWEAIRAGAPAVVLEEDIGVPGATAIYVSDALNALSRLAARFHRFPARKLWIAGITGTNGKTTVASLLAGILEAAGLTTGVLGTVAYRLGSEVREASNTTPLADDLHTLLRQMVDRTLFGCVMEVSSHALALQRVEDVEFDVGVVTNVTRDHLDFHKTMEAYAEAKARLLTMLSRPGSKARHKRAVLNRDDPWMPFMERYAHCDVATFGTHPAAHVRWENVVATTTGTTF
ncbi:MAG: UDP-N-acetylmuramoyl-L-alanyl-D-glutamate--2,6-diaminopimelate ligase, partial [Elusimicrobia bacterium]|nr:UDP-N-acetylmuramoyl-L-alanyl-D-glutamate--2,6-diaminopimelate ligase [Elusimicrobiota bacterium]